MPISSRELSPFLSSHKTFVETGSSAFGYGIAAALNAGYNAVYSVEINPADYTFCKSLFGHNPKVELTLGDCGVWLDKTLDKIAEPCTLFLDANGYSGETESPFHASINAIIRHGAKHHVILVDDMNHGRLHRDVMLDELRRSRDTGPQSDIINQLRRVNSDYVFYPIDTWSEDRVTCYPSWVLVADTMKGRFPAMREDEYV